MVFLKKLIKLTISYFSLIPIIYLVIYEIFFSQTQIINKQLIDIFQSWNTNFIEDIIISEKSFECPIDYENIFIDSQKLNITDRHQTDIYTVCIKRLLNSKIFQQDPFFYSKPESYLSHRVCSYKNVDIQIYKERKCPISDIQFSKENYLEGYSLVENQQLYDLNVFVARNNEYFKPLVQIQIRNVNTKPQEIEFKLNYLDKSLEENDYGRQVSFDIQQQQKLIEFNQIEKYEQIDIGFEKKLYIYSKQVIEMSYSCLLYRNNLFELKLIYSNFLVHLSAYLQLCKSTITILNFIFEELSPFKHFPFSLAIICFLTDALYIYSTFYLRLEYYLFIDSLLSKGCFDTFGVVYQMKQQFDPQKQIIGIVISSLTLLFLTILFSVLFTILTFTTKIIQKMKYYISKPKEKGLQIL